MTVFGCFHWCHPGRGASRSDALLIRDPYEVQRFKVLKMVFSNRGTHVKPILFCFSITAAAWSMVLYVIGA